jgi:hypothetical protein
MPPPSAAAACAATHPSPNKPVPPGEVITLARAWTRGRTAHATAARIAVEVHPDDFYERFYTEKLAGPLVPAQRALYQQALARALGSHYVAEQRDVPIDRDTRRDTQP